MNHEDDMQAPSGAETPDPAVEESSSDDRPDDVPEVPGAVALHAFIGRQLRAIYDDVAAQPVPDRFLTLMRQLDAKADDAER